MISVVITSSNEARLISRAITAVINQLDLADEIIVIAPDRETLDVANSIKVTMGKLKVVQDLGVGKPAALNQGLKLVKGDLIVFTDGDVEVDSSAITWLLKPFKDHQVGMVTGRPISILDRNKMLGFWSIYLTEVAHFIRLKQFNNKKFVEASGYLYAIRSNLINEIPINTLAEDAVISHFIAQKGYKTAYAPEARVKVLYPTSLSDWIKQKVRSTGGYAQTYVTDSSQSMRSFKSEVIEGLKFAITFPRSIKELFWLLGLFIMRLYIWILVFIRVRVLGHSVSQLWHRVESTKRLEGNNTN